MKESALTEQQLAVQFLKEFAAKQQSKVKPLTPNKKEHQEAVRKSLKLEAQKAEAALSDPKIAAALAMGDETDSEFSQIIDPMKEVLKDTFRSKGLEIEDRKNKIDKVARHLELGILRTRFFGIQELIFSRAGFTQPRGITKRGRARRTPVKSRKPRKTN